MADAQNLETLLAGPFPDSVDPWAEAGRYFHQLHSGLIEQSLDQIGLPLLQRGYLVGKETSLQIAENRKPDLFVRYGDFVPSPPTLSPWSYVAEATAVESAVGLALEAEMIPDLQNIVIHQRERGRLITVIEFISPRNKLSPFEIEAYQQRRQRLLYQGVHVVEIDLTRSNKRLVELDPSPLDARLDYAYAVMVFVVGQAARLIPISVGDSLPRIAIPLHAEVIPLALQPAYTRAYRTAMIAPQMLHDDHYNEAGLPFPSLLTLDQRQTALATLTRWQSDNKIAS